MELHKVITSKTRILLLLGLSLSGILRTHGQVPEIRVDGKELNLVRLQNLDIQVSIVGTMATTTWTMTFLNKTNRILEGELVFPLAEGISVSRYALDINGRMREAVPVGKERGTVVFENVERRRVDPGLLEKVEGNQFRTRIYPINPNGTRTVVIGYQQELSLDRDHQLKYRLPLAFRNRINQFNIRIDVIRNAVAPVLEEGPDHQLQFNKWEENWSASHQWKGYTAGRPITISIPKQADGGEVMMQQVGNHYFYLVNTFPAAKVVARAQPAIINLLWDVSLSGLYRDSVKEAAFLEAYFSRLKQVSVRLICFSNKMERPRDFEIKDGDWRRLREVLRQLTYDGATQFGSIDLKQYPADETLLFSDGHGTFGDNSFHPGGHPVYAIVSSARTDFPFLRYVTGVSGGELIDLNQLEVSGAIDLLKNQVLQFLGVKKMDGVDESFPSIPTPVVGSVSVAGISYQPCQEVVLQFGYGGKVTMEKKVLLDYDRQQVQQVDLSRFWAQKKIAELDLNYSVNKDEVAALGKRYGIVTRNTSLIVLENVMDYVNYGIEPPDELRPEYDRIMKDRGNERLSLDRRTADKADPYFNVLLSWWTTKIEEPRALKKDTLSAVMSANAGTSVTQVLEGRVPGLTVSQGNPGATNSVRVRGRSGGNANAAASRASNGHADAEAYMDEVVVTGYVSAKRRDVTSSVTSVQSEGLANARPASYNHEETERPEISNNNPHVGPDGGYFSPKVLTDTSEAYLTEIRLATPENRYATYLLVRRDFLETPMFYYNTANYFISIGSKEIGMRILSNIAELDAENYELFKLLGYKLKELGEYKAESQVFKKVLDWRPFEPQSYRDYGLALVDAGEYQTGLDTLYQALVRNYAQEVSGLYPGIEETILPEINQLIAAKADKLDISRIPKNLIRNMPVDIRVVLNWNMNDTDIDLWVTDPNGEKCYYSHKSTMIGGRISQDFTRGLGPEQFLLRKAMKGKYKVEVNYYGDRQVKLAGPTSLMVEVYTHYGSPEQVRQVITMQMQKYGNGGVLVGEFNF